MKIAILGFGTVGSGTYEIISQTNSVILKNTGSNLEVKYILDIRDFSSRSDAHLFVNDFDIILNDPEVDTVIETIGGLNPAFDYSMKALKSGKNVITSNKELVATYGNELIQTAVDNNVKYMFEASVGGGIPIIRQLFHCFTCNEITEIKGILNGTTNYILTQMFKNGESFEQALKAAQQKGYAEKDPTADIEGQDTCKKICILSSVISGKSVDFKNVYTEGITKISKEDTEFAQVLGYCIRLIGESIMGDDGYMQVHVAPMLIDNEHIFSKIEDVYNGIIVKGQMTDDTMSYGRGAGKLPTASAVVADAIEVEKNKKIPYMRPWKKADKNYVVPHDEYERKYYLRCETQNRTGLMEEIEKTFGITDSCDTPENEVAVITNAVKFKDISQYKPKCGTVLSLIEVMK